jgi:hypothetical protein
LYLNLSTRVCIQATWAVSVLHGRGVPVQRARAPDSLPRHHSRRRSRGAVAVPAAHADLGGLCGLPVGGVGAVAGARVAGMISG